MGASFLLARRLSLSSGGKHSSPAVLVAIASIALSVIVMMGAIAIVLGFKEEITRKVAGFNSHILLTPYTPTEFSAEGEASEQYPTDNVITLTPTLKKVISETEGVTDVALQASIPAIFKTSSEFKGIYLKSLTGKSLEEFIASAIIDGKIPDYSTDSDSIIISSNTASQLNLKAGDKINTYFISDRLRVRQLKVAAVFDSHFDAYDDNIGFGDLSLIQSMGNLSTSQGTNLTVSVDNIDNVAHIESQLTDNLIKGYTKGEIYKLYQSESVLKSGAAYFQWLRMLDMNVAVVLILMTIVACVTLCSGMLIMMADKIRIIALLNALGARRTRISRVFILLATRITVYGLLAGDIIGAVILWLQNKYRFIPLDPDSYYIDYVPVKLDIPSFILLNIAVIIIVFCVLALPAYFAAHKSPARILAAE